MSDCDFIGTPLLVTVWSKRSDCILQQTSKNCVLTRARPRVDIRPSEVFSDWVKHGGAQRQIVRYSYFGVHYAEFLNISTSYMESLGYNVLLSDFTSKHLLRCLASRHDNTDACTTLKLNDSNRVKSNYSSYILISF